MFKRSQIKEDVEVLISGGGITGVAAALYCRSRGISCEIHESRSATGGILQDWICDKSDWYFRNCQYLSPRAAWSKLLPQSLLLTFPHIYGSFTDLWGETCAFQGYAGPIYSLRKPLDALRECQAVSLSDRLNIYPQQISHPLMEWVKRFGICPERTHSSGAFGLQISRIFPLHFARDIQSYKAANISADELYGLPREYFGLGSALASLPQAGFTQYFKDIEKHLMEQKIKLRLNSTIKPSFLFPLPDSGVSQNSEPAVVWTGNPVPLIRSVSSHDLDAPNFKMRNIVVKFKYHFFDNPFYIQVFSKIYSITRIFVYYNKATFECFDNAVKASDVVSSGLEILLPFLGKIEKPEEIHQFSETRHFLSSIEDYMHLEHFALNNSCKRLIPSPWHIYGRDSKIEKILSLLDNHFQGQL